MVTELAEVMKRYPKYKDSDVEWLAEIPEHWRIVKFRRVCKLKQGLQIAQSERFYEPGINRLEYLTIKSINAVNSNTPKEYIENPPFGVICLPDDVLLARTGATGEVISGYTAVFHNNFFKISYDSRTVDKQYLIYYLKNPLLKNYLLLLAGTTTIPDLNHGEFLDTHFLVPPLCEQKTIACFIDRKLVQIDQFISNKQRFIELLKEQKSAIINRAVTKGLNPDAPMKPSGIEWLGDIPQGWEVKRLRFLILNGTQNGLYKSKDYYRDNGTPIISMAEAFSSLLISSLAKDRVQLTEEEYRSYSLERGDLLFARRSIVFEGSGKCSMVYDLPEVHIFESSLIRVRPDITVIKNMFFLLFLNCAFCRLQILKITKQVTISGINASDLKDVLVLIPPLVEQDQIISYVKHKSAKIDLAITKAKQEIELIQEYRTTLISDAVTGKIDVREFTHNS